MTIEPFYPYNATRVGISLYKFAVDGETLYQPSLLLWLDVKDSDNSAVCIDLNRSEECPHCAIILAYQIADTFSDSVLVDIPVYDETGDMIEVMDLDEMLEESEEESVEESV